MNQKEFLKEIEKMLEKSNEEHLKLNPSIGTVANL